MVPVSRCCFLPVLKSRRNPTSLNPTYKHEHTHIRQTFGFHTAINHSTAHHETNTTLTHKMEKQRVEFPGRRMLNASTSLLFLPWHCNIPRIRLGVLKLIQSPSQKSSPKQNKRGKNSNSLHGIFSSSSHK